MPSDKVKPPAEAQGGGGILNQKPGDILRVPDNAEYVLRRVYRRCLTRLIYPKQFDFSRSIRVLDALLTREDHALFRTELRTRLCAMLDGIYKTSLAELLLEALETKPAAIAPAPAPVATPPRPAPRAGAAEVDEHRHLEAEQPALSLLLQFRLRSQWYWAGVRAPC